MPSAHAQVSAYPAKPVRVLLGFAPGGATDIVARMFAQKLSESLGRSFVVENRPGGGGTTATTLVIKSPPDGHTLLAVSGTFSITPAITKSLPFDSLRDLMPISLVNQSPFLVVVHPALPAKNIRELVALTSRRTRAAMCPGRACSILRKMADPETLKNAKGEDGETPEAKVSSQWTENEDSALPETPFKSDKWWEALGDPALNRLIDEAYKSNYSLQIAGVRVLEARAQLGVAIGQSYPQQQALTGDYTAARQSPNSSTAIPIPGFQTLNS